MRKVVILAAMSAMSAWAQVNQLREVTVTAKRTLKDAGIVRTEFDSVALKENIALSMADVLSYNSSVFVKNYGRATLSTVAFRGTSPSHTKVTWNGIDINSPMLGMTDFSTIPSFFIDKASLEHGTSSVNETGGGLGGLVKLGTVPQIERGLGVQYVQGVGSFSTFDQFARLTYGTEHWKFSTRAVYSSSPNNFKYVNRDKKLNIYDDNHQIIGQYHPVEENRSGAFRDFHALQETYYTNGRGQRVSASVWYTLSRRELPLLTTDYADNTPFENLQRDNTLRTSLRWDWRISQHLKTVVGAGYTYQHTAYDYSRENAPGQMAVMTRSRSTINTWQASGAVEWTPRRNWFVTADVKGRQVCVLSHDRDVALSNGELAAVGYDAGRFELSASGSVRWQPVPQVGLSGVLRAELNGTQWSPVIPALLADATLWRPINLTARASVSRNYRCPTLNDLYFMPGGNRDLQPERGFTYDAGLSAERVVPVHFPLSVRMSAGWFDSYIDNWIMWLPTTKGFYSPRNVKKVHSYGVECRLGAAAEPWRGWQATFDGSYSWTPSLNVGQEASAGDQSIGRQLPYVPRHSGSFNARMAWRGWGLGYRWCWYSRRYTMSSNEAAPGGVLPVYFMNNVTLEKNLPFRIADVQLKLAVNNLFNEEYVTVLSRPMPGINFEFFVSITPKIGKRK